MSVFQLQDWWRVQVSQDAEEEFDQGCMVVGNIDNSSPAAGTIIIKIYILNTYLISILQLYEKIDKIAIGSLKGIIRIFYPTKAEFKGGPFYFLRLFGF
jgi:hypothetical protein